MLINAHPLTSSILLLSGIMVATSLASPAIGVKDLALPDTPKVRVDQIYQNYGKLPMRFEANQGQTGANVKFLSRGIGYGLFLTSREAVLTLRKPSGAPHQKTDVVHMQLNDSNMHMNPTGIDPLPGTSNYLLGQDESKWHTGVSSFSKVRYADVYPGVDLIYYGNQQQLEYDFVVAPNANPKPIQIHFSGATSLRLDQSGNLIIAAESGKIAFHKPVIYQVLNGIRERVPGAFRILADNSAGFTIGKYDRAQPLIIDPTLIYSTYLGGSNSDSIVGIALDSSGNAYLTGSTSSTDYPVTPGVIESTDKDPSSTVFVTKLNSSGSALIYSTYLGGSGSPSGGDSGQAIAVDSAGNAYVTGYTYSSNFPTTTGAYQLTNKAAANSGSTSFVSKINTTGTALVYSTYLGGTMTDSATSIAIDSAGDAYVAGVTFSSDFPVTTGALQSTNKSAASDDGTAFVTKLNPTATSLLYSTYLGGSNDYVAASIVRVAIDSAGEAFLSGAVGSTDFPVTTGAYQTTNKGIAGGGSNLTLSKLNPTATKLIYSTYLGGSGAGYRGDVANSLAIDSAGNAYLAGTTYESNYPVTTGAFQKTNKDFANDLPTGFVTKMNPAGTTLVYSTFLGGSGGSDGDRAIGLAIDAAGDAFITGSTGSTDFPVTSNAYQSTNLASFNNGAVVFLTELNPAGSSELYSTYFGGANSFADAGYGVALSSSGDVYLTGTTGASNFPITKNAYKSTFNSANFTTGFVAEFTVSTAPATAPTGTLLTSSENPAVTGSNLTFTASVVPDTGTAIPTGNVVFNVDQKNVVTLALNSKGFASYTTSTPLALGQHAVLASYAGSTTYSASAGNITQDIVPAAPTILPGSGTYPAAQLVTIAASTSNSTIYYTVDGTTPTTASTKYTVPILVNTNETVRAVAAYTGAPSSNIISAFYTVISAPTSLAVAASSISTPTATLNALINSNGLSGSYFFRYGTSATALTSVTPTTALKGSVLGSRLGFTPMQVNAGIAGLKTKTTYYYQVVVTTTAGTSSGAMLSFTTN